MHVVDEKLWKAGQACDEHEEFYCPDCKPASEKQTVYISDGGTAYHKRADCAGLEDGQRYVENRGGTPSEIKAIQVSGAKSRGRQKCLVCWID